jgi:hypothetical protein
LIGRERDGTLPVPANKVNHSGVRDVENDVENNGCWSDCTPRCCIPTCPRAGSFIWGTRNPVGNFDGYADESRQGGATADYWPAIEDAIRTEAQDREARIATAAKRLAELRQNPIEILQTPDPVDLLQRRADALAQRSADLKKLAGAWQPLYETLTPDQKKRMASLSLFVLRNMSNATQQRDLQCDEEQ